MSDLEDNLDDPQAAPQAYDDNEAADEAQRMKADLFGEDDDDEQPQDEDVAGRGADQAEDDYQPGLEDNLEDDIVATAPGIPAKPVDRRAALAELAQKKRSGAGEGEGSEKSRKRSKPDKGDRPGKRDKAEKASKRDKGDKSRKQRKRRSGASAGGSDGADEEDYRPDRAAGQDASSPTAEVLETERDRAFIDDEGAEPGNPVPVDEDDEQRLGHISEAEEGDEHDMEDDIDKLMKPKRRKKKDDEGQVAHAVESLCAKMEVAAEEDVRLQSIGQPAVNKLKMLKEVREFLSQRKVHELFISQGGLGVLKAWLEPYGDGSLPNVTVRSTILNICQALPVDTAREDMKDKLKRSELGSRIMFLFKCPAESPGNKLLARELVEKWSRPIFVDLEAEAEKRQQKLAAAQDMRRQRMAVQQAADSTALEEARRRMQLKPGEVGYRIHAAMPQASKLDYVVEPGRGGEPAVEVRAARGAGAASNAKDTAFNRKMRELQRKQKMTSARAMKPSVEGRGMVL